MSIDDFITHLERARDALTAGSSESADSLVIFEIGNDSTLEIMGVLVNVISDTVTVEVQA